MTSDLNSLAQLTSPSVFLNSMRILGIETSCDETGIAVFDDQADYSVINCTTDRPSATVACAELASRAHQALLPMIRCGQRAPHARCHCLY